MGLGEADQVANRPGDDVAVAVEVPLTSAADPEGAGDVSGHLGFLGDDGDSHDSPQLAQTDDPEREAPLELVLAI